MGIRMLASLALTVLATVPSGPWSTDRAALAAPELVVNGSFADGTVAPWWNSANTATRVEDGRLRVDVAGGTVDPWQAMVGQSAIPLASGTAYTLAFDAAATASVTVRAQVQLEDPPYTAPLATNVTLDTTTRRFSFPFTSNLTTTRGQVTFQLGGHAQNLTVFLDDISLTASSGSPNPIELTSGFYTDPDSNPAEWVRANGGDPRAARIRAEIASKPGARWFGDWSGDISAAVSAYVGAADAADKLPILAAFNIPGRDCGGHSGGGAGSPEAYRAWIAAFAAAIGSRPAIVVLEPDALAQLDCMPVTEQTVRLDLLRYATERLREHAPNTWAYLDAGHARWPADATVMANRLQAAGLRNIRGFALNVSNFHTTADNTAKGDAINAALATRHGFTTPFLIDTSRNGNGSAGDGQWCNPPGRKLGTPSAVGGQLGTGAELLLWIKVPGDSDGPCGTAPTVPAGTFSPDLAIALLPDSTPAPEFPDATNTGVPPGVTLRPSGDLTITQNGAVIDALDIRGCVEVHASNVTIRRSRIACTTGTYPVRLFSGFTGLLVEDVEITGRPDRESIAIAFSNYTVRRANIHHVSDGPRIGDNTVVEDSYIHDLVRCAGCHNDGIQSTGGRNLRIRHNNVQHPDGQTSCILLGEERKPMDDAIIENNLLNGGNYTVYAGIGTTSPNITIRNNRFGRDFVYGLLAAAQPRDVAWTGNVWHDTGDPIPRP